MNKFANLLGKELRELLTIKMVLPFVLSILILAFVGTMIRHEEQRTSFAADIIVVDLDQTRTSANAVKILKSGGYTVQFLEPAPLDSLIVTAVEQNASSFLIIPAGFEQRILQKNGAEIEFYSVIRSLGFSAAIERRSARNIVAVMNRGISDDYLREMNKDLDPVMVKNPVRANEFVYMKGKIRPGSGQAIIAVVMMQTIFIPVILFILIIFAGTMIASSMAQEKENKTLETLLTVPISRFSIIAAKMTAAMILAGVFAAVFVLGFGTYMSGMTSTSSGDIAQAQEAMKELSLDYGITLDLNATVLLGISIFLSIVLALLIATLLAVFTQDVKDVQASIAPLMILILIPYLISIMMDPQTMPLALKIFIFMIPFSHTFFAFKYLLLGEIAPVLWGILYLAFCTFIFLMVTIKIFSSDKILTMKFRLGRKKRQLETP